MITKAFHIHDDVIAKAKTALSQSFENLSPNEYGLNKHGKYYYKYLLQENIKNADRSHLEPIFKPYKINWNPANCASRCTTSALFDTMTFEEYALSIQLENKIRLQEYRNKQNSTLKLK